ncbi:MAG: hypothetical protein ACRC2T_17685, partial [Thermoguttaceae bacterium]
GGSGMMGGNMGGGAGRTGAGADMFTRSTGNTYVAPVLVNNYLFRYFDFNVEEGKDYQYRVQLVLRNPNYGLDPKVLETPELSSKNSLTSKFSEPTVPVSSGTVARILATNVTAPRNPIGEPTASVMPIYFEFDQASEWVCDDKNLVPGQVANFKGNCYAPAAQRSMGTMMGGTSSTGPGAQAVGTTRPPQAAKTNKTFNNIDSEVCFIDAFGGYQLEGNDRLPGKVLVMDQSGTLVIRDVNKDSDETRKYAKPTATTPGRGTTGGGSGR